VTPPRQPIYLSRRTHRIRRLVDAARFLPLLGMFLLALPIVWAAPDAPMSETAREGIYLFAVWFGLIVVALLLAPGLARVSASDGTEAEETGQGTSGSDGNGG
jgi:hypothetical protein